MSPVSLSQQLLGQLDVLIAAVADDPILRQGLLRERRRLAAHLDATVEPWLRSQNLDLPKRYSRNSARRPSPYQLAACQRQARARTRGYFRLRHASYLAIDAELIDARIFDRLQLLGRRALRGQPEPASSSYASSSSPSAGGGSTGEVSGVRCSGPPIGASRGGVLSPLPSRTNRSSVSTSRAWA